MAVTNYEGTNEGSASGWQRRFHSEFKGSNGRVYRVEIIDSGGHATRALAGFGGTGSQPFLLGSDGVTISWDSDDIHEPVISSELTLDMVVEGTYHRQLFAALSGVEDDRFGVALWRHAPDAQSSTGPEADDTPSGTWALEWVGLIDAEGVEFVDHEVNELLRLTARDGLARLNSIPYLDDSDNPFEDSVPLSTTVLRCLGKIPTADLFGYGFSSGAGTLSATSTVPLFTEDVYYLTERHDNVAVGIHSVLQNTLASQLAFASVERGEDDLGGKFKRTEVVSCAEVLREICAAFRARLTMTGGAFRFQNPSSQQATSYRHTFAHRSVNRAENTVGTPLSAGNQRLTLDDENINPTRGLSSSFLPPLAKAVSIHVDGGATVLLQAPPSATFPPPPSGFPAWSFPFKNDGTSEATLANPDAIVDGEVALFMGFLGKVLETGWGGPGNSSLEDDAFRGGKIVVHFRLKVGAYYLKRTLVSASSGNAVTINIPAATDIDFLDWTQSGDVEWTTTPSTYAFVVPRVGGDPEPPVVLQGTDNDVQRVGGFHLELASSGDAFTFTNGWAGDGTLQMGHDFPVEWTIPALPAGTHYGVQLDAYALFYDADNDLISSGVIDALPFSSGQAILASQFVLATSSPEDEADLTFASSVAGTGNLIETASESVLGDAYLDSGAGSLRHRVPGNTTPPVWAATGSASWRTVDDTGTNYLHQLNANELVRARSKSVRLFSGTFAHDPSQALGAYIQATFDEPMRFHRSVRYSVTEGATAVDFDCVVQSLTWGVRGGTFDAVLVVAEVDRTISPTDTNNINELGKPGKGKPPSGVIGSGNPITEAVLTVKGEALTGGSGGISAADQLKLDAITTTPGGQINDIDAYGKVLTADNIEDQSSLHKFATSAQLGQIATNASELSTLYAVFKETSGGAAGGGLFVTPGSESASFVKVTSTESKIQAGGATAVTVTESSPGTITISVQSGTTGNEVQVDAITVAGSSLTTVPTITTNALFNHGRDFNFTNGGSTVTFTAGTSGIQYSDLSGTPTLPTPLADGDQTIGEGVTRDIVLDGAAANNTFFRIVDANGGIIFRIQNYGTILNIVEYYGLIAYRSTSTVQGSIALYEANANGTNFIQLRAPSSVAADRTFILPGDYGTSGQFLQTDGTGNMTWATASGGMTETPLIQVGGRWQWSSADDGERVHTGSSAYGPTNWYSHSQEPSNSTLRVYSSSHTVDTTTATISGFHLMAYGHPLPSDSKKVRVKTFSRYQNGNASTFGWSLWHCSSFPTDGTANSATVTLVAKSSDSTPDTGTTDLWRTTFTTTSALSGGMVFLLAEHRSGSLTTTTYAYATASLFLVD